MLALSMCSSDSFRAARAVARAPRARAPSPAAPKGDSGASSPALPACANRRRRDLQRRRADTGRPIRPAPRRRESAGRPRRRPQRLVGGSGAGAISAGSADPSACVQARWLGPCRNQFGPRGCRGRRLEGGQRWRRSERRPGVAPFSPPQSRSDPSHPRVGSLGMGGSEGTGSPAHGALTDCGRRRGPGRMRRRRRRRIMIRAGRVGPGAAEACQWGGVGQPGWPSRAA